MDEREEEVEQCAVDLAPMLQTVLEKARQDALAQAAARPQSEANEAATAEALAGAEARAEELSVTPPDWEAYLERVPTAKAGYAKFAEDRSARRKYAQRRLVRSGGNSGASVQNLDRGLGD